MVDIPANTSTTAVFQFDNAQTAGVFDGVFEPTVTAPDGDWVRLDVSSTTSYQFYLSMQGLGAATTAGPKISVYNSTGGLINSFFFDGTGNVKTGTLNFTAGTYFIEATTSSGTQIGNYSLGITNQIRTDLAQTGGNDVITPGPGGRYLGGYGNDVINLSSVFGVGPDAMGEQGNDELTGNGDANRLWGGTGGDTLIGLAGNDILFGDHDDDHLLGGNNDDQLFGGTGNDVLSGDAGADTLVGGAGDDFMLGGNGNDIFIVDSAGDTVIEDSGENALQTAEPDFGDTIFSTVSFNLAANGANIEILALQGTANLNGTGNGLVNLVQGNEGSNVLDGGSAGNDGVVDRLYGLLGNDTYVLGGGGDTIDFETGGIDTITSSITRSLLSFTGVENLTLIGAVAANATGNTVANTIIGNGAVNIIAGGLGNDRLTGGLGKDSFVFNTLANTATNKDTITDFKVIDDTIRIENAIFNKVVGANNTTLSAVQFHKGAAAHDANDRFIYNAASGVLTYDSNGNAAGGAVQIAVLSKGLAMTNADFFII